MWEGINSNPVWDSYIVFVLHSIFFLEDVDECAENNTLCGSLQCANLPGSFQCLGKCDVGFKRTMDDKECVGKMHVEN